LPQHTDKEKNINMDLEQNRHRSHVWWGLDEIIHLAQLFFSAESQLVENPPTHWAWSRDDPQQAFLFFYKLSAVFLTRHLLGVVPAQPGHHESCHMGLEPRDPLRSPGTRRLLPASVSRHFSGAHRDVVSCFLHTQVPACCLLKFSRWTVAVFVQPFSSKLVGCCGRERLLAVVDDPASWFCRGLS